jgi:glycosyltransferase involved in cell wall biosynthesis
VSTALKQSATNRFPGIIVIKIVHIITGLAPDGAEKMLYRLVAGMDSNIFQNQVISLTDLGPMAANIQASGAQVRALGMRPGVPGPRYVIRLARWLRHLQPHVVQTWMYHADLLGGIAARLSGSCSVVWNIRHSELRPGVDKRHTLWTASACARLSRRVPRRIVCCSEASRQFHTKMGYAADRMEVIPNGFDVDLFKPDAAQRSNIRGELAISDAAPVIGLIARYHLVKGHRNFVEAAGLLHRNFPQVKFLLCGEEVTVENRDLRAQIVAAGIQDVCQLLGQRDDIPRVLNALDIATSASTGEAFPNVVAEAMATAVPCVVTDVGDSRLIVGDTGRVVPSGAPPALTQAWRELLESGPDARRSLGLAARQRIEENFSLKATIDQYQRLYVALAEREPSSARLHAKTVRVEN